MKKLTKAVLDGDILMYRAAFWADSEGIDELPTRLLQDIRNWTPEGVKKVYIAMSCPRARNFRRVFWPKYKEHRDDFKRPDSMEVALECIYDIANTTIRCVDRLEADDLIGMLVSEGKYIGVTVDKDLRQIPGWHWNPDKEPEPVHISVEDADKYFYQQWMTGDGTDNIWGLWKVGPAKAQKILDNTPREDWDKVILTMYEEEDWSRRPETKLPSMTKQEYALAQARCVRILRQGDFNKKAFTIQLWSPNNLVDRNILDLNKE